MQRKLHFRISSWNEKKGFTVHGISQFPLLDKLDKRISFSAGENALGETDWVIPVEQWKVSNEWRAI